MTKALDAKQISRRMRALANPTYAKHHQSFFKTASGEYGEGDRFLGIRVPVLRGLAKEFESLSLAETATLLRSALHEERFLALIILVRQFERDGDGNHTSIYQLYLKHTDFINNWDLVDCSAHKIIGAYLLNRDRDKLYELAESDQLWERRIAIIATLRFIQNEDYDDTLSLAALLLKDDHDLIQKAVGWMLREVGKRDYALEEAFLREHYKTMPRTMLRYAIEKFPDATRKAYLCGTI